MKAGILFKPAYRSGLEEKVAAQLTRAGVEIHFEKVKLFYNIPERRTFYLADFPYEGPKIILEAKGRFGHNKSDAQGARERQKYLLVKEQHPEWDIRFVFENATKKIYKGSKVTYAEWCDENGFKFSDKGIVPSGWLEEIKAAKKGTA